MVVKQTRESRTPQQLGLIWGGGVRTDGLVHSERIVGVAVAGIALALLAPVLLAGALAAIVTALARAFG
jgi:hypothetical protein